MAHHGLGIGFHAQRRRVCRLGLGNLEVVVAGLAEAGVQTANFAHSQAILAERLESSRSELVAHADAIKREVEENDRLRKSLSTMGEELSDAAYIAPVTLAVLRALQASEEQPRTSPLSLLMPAHNGGDRSFQVAWRRTDGPAIEADPIRYAVPALDGDYFSITLRLMTV